MITFSKSILKGYGQIMLQNNYFTGLLFLLAIAYESIWIALVSLISNLIAVIVSTIADIFMVKEGWITLTFSFRFWNVGSFINKKVFT